MNNLLKILKNNFGFDEFKNGQEEIIHGILECRDTLAVMPTGGGKSLCFQLPSLILPGTTIVISPLIALMKDQVDKLQKSGIPATSIDSTISFAETQSRFKDAANGKFKMIYVAPERLESKSFLELLRIIEISFIAVDEAHCISEWGHDFRVSYLNINKIFNYIPRCPVMALTATATKEVREDIIKILALKNPVLAIKGFDRKNLHYSSEYCEKKIDRIADICSATKDGSTIIYAGSRKRVEQFSSDLHQIGIKNEGYHAGMKTLIRSAVQDRFISGKTRVIVATNAFGMGIDKYDVRNVIHIDLPLTIEAYYQEAGRAGRDGLPASCYLLFNNTDLSLPEFFIQATYPSRGVIDRIFKEIIRHIDSQEYSEKRSIAIPDPLILANNLGIDFITVDSVYKLFQRNGVIQKGNINSQAKIKFTSGRERLQEYHENLSQERQTALEAIMRSVSSDVFDRFVSLNVRDVMHKHLISKEQFDDIIKSLQLLKIALFVSELEGTGFFLNKYYSSINELSINFDDLNRRYALALSKLDKVVEYSGTEICKRNFILEYFDDYSYQGNCEKCTSCKSSKIKNEIFTSYDRFLNCSILLWLNSSDRIIDLAELTKKFITESDLSVGFGKTIKKSSNISSLIKEEIKKLLQRRLIKFTDSFNQKISITPEGKEFIKHIPEQINIMARREKDKTASEIIFSKLVTLRREIAEHAGVVPRGIISDVALKKIAEVMPETEYDLKNVAGVSQLFVQKFAKLFLQELAKIKLNPKEQKVSKVAHDTLRLLEQGTDFETIKSRLFAGNLSMAANYIVEILEAGHPLPRKAMLPDAVYSKIKSCVKKFPELGPRDIQAKLTIEVDTPTLKIGWAFARQELGIY